MPSDDSKAVNPTDVKLETAEFDPRFREEIDAVFWLFEEVRAGKHLPVLEAEAVGHSLYVSMRLDGRVNVELLPLHDMKEYNAVHSINVALVAMGTAESIGYEERAVRAIGIAGLLHDIGMVRMPLDLLAKAEQFTEAEREIITRHPVEGATIIAESDAALDLAAVVAYEHHIKPDGTGYPQLSFPRKPDRISSLIAVCDTFHALRSPRPFRDAWPQEIVSSFLQQRAGFDFDTEMVDAVTAVMRRQA